MSQPRADDFRVDLRGAELVVTHTLTGSVFIFDLQTHTGNGGPVAVRRGVEGVCSDDDIRRIAIEIAAVARKNASGGEDDL